jgi:ArsR family transcriptional regulator
MIPQKMESANRQAEICSVFGNPKRIMILWFLLEQEKSVGEIAEEIGASMQCTSQHLRLMKDKGILKSTRIGQTITYRVAENSVVKNCLLISRKRHLKEFSDIHMEKEKE